MKRSQAKEPPSRELYPLNVPNPFDHDPTGGSKLEERRKTTSVMDM
jgi:hypothetical protein